MTGHFPIGLLAWLFGLASIGCLVATAYRFRRRPVTALIAGAARREAFHRDTLAALEAAIAAAQTEGRPAEAGRLAPSLAVHRHALAGLAQAREFAGRR